MLNVMSRRWSSARSACWLVLGGVCLTTFYACDVYDSSLLVPEGTGGAGGVSDAGSDVSSGGGADKQPFWPHQTGNGCDTQGVPTADQRPAVDDGDDLTPSTSG